MHFKRNIAKTNTPIILILLIASATIMAIQANAQTTLPPGVTPTNLQSNGSIPLPAGVTPDIPINTIASLSFTPNPIGIGQSLLVNIWIHPATHGSRYLSSYTVTFTKPDGSTDQKVVNSYQADTTAWFNYAPDQVGTWKVKFAFPGGYFPAGNYTGTPGSFVGAGPFSFTQSVYYKPSSDGPYDLTVQQNMVMSWPVAPLPTDYWTRPVSPENREWWPILGNYPGTGIVGGGSNWPANTNTYMSNYLFTPYALGPNTCHVVWRRQGSEGGLIGGIEGQTSYIAGSPGPGAGTPTIIYNGRCYQTLTKVMQVIVNGSYRSMPTTVWECYDLRTGQVYWDQTGNTQIPTVISYRAQEFQAVPGAVSYNRGYPELVFVGGGRFIKYEPNSGNVDVNVSIAPLTTGTFYNDPYFLSIQTIGSGANAQYRLINWTVLGSAGTGAVALSNFQLAILNNITWPFSSLGTVDYETGISVTTYGFSSSATGVTTEQGIQAASITTGQLLWNITSGVGYPFFSGSTSVADHGKFAVRFDDGYWYCWDLSSGKQLWKSELTTWPWGTFGCYGTASYGGNIIANQYDGVAAYNWTNGKVSWLYQSKSPFAFETPYQDNNPYFTGVTVIADGKIFTYNTEHTPSQPETRGWKLGCINATNGKNVWNITGDMVPGAVADGYITAASSYDGYEYVFGKGPSVTSVMTPDTAVEKGTTVVIKGTVMDMSPGDQGSYQNPTAAPNSQTAPGKVPCVSSDSMETQMEYLYLQRPIDGLSHNLTITGVPVLLTAIGSDASVYEIGTIVTNGYYGTFGATWSPPKEDTYTIVAQFGGDNSYGSSSAATTLVVGPTPSTPSQPEPQTPIDYSMTIVGAAVAVIIAVAIAAVAIILLVRKK